MRGLKKSIPSKAALMGLTSPGYNSRPSRDLKQVLTRTLTPAIHDYCYCSSNLCPGWV